MNRDQKVLRLKELREQQSKIEDEISRIQSQLKNEENSIINRFKGLRAFASGDTLIVAHYKGVEIFDSEEGGWAISDRDDVLGFGIPLTEDPPMDWGEFDLKCKSIAKELGLRIKYGNLKRRTEGGIESLSALRFLHPGKEVSLIKEGKVWYVGWDIPDEYFIASIDGVEHAFWGDDGHGGENQKSARKGDPSWNFFTAFLERDGKE